MPTTTLLPAGSSAATSASFTLAGGQTADPSPVPRALPGGGSIYWRADVQRRMTDGAWETIGALSWEAKMLTLYGDGGCRVHRPEGSGCMVDGALALATGRGLQDDAQTFWCGCTQGRRLRGWRWHWASWACWRRWCKRV